MGNVWKTNHSRRQESGRGIENFDDHPIAKLTIQNSFTHGKEAVVSDITTMESGMKYDYCYMFELVSPGKHIIKANQILHNRYEQYLGFERLVNISDSFTFHIIPQVPDYPVPK